MSDSKTPTVGDIVLYLAYGTPGGEYKKQYRAAIITDVADPEKEIVTLAILNPTGIFFSPPIPKDDGSHKSGTWTFRINE